ncbi:MULTISPECIES: zinc-finger-containing protein [Acinetobacter]|uniref:zinc-finger-containing protein n=1 Tax=Acinetobacter TaxID=469 RepID=UPI00124ACE76
MYEDQNVKDYLKPRIFIYRKVRCQYCNVLSKVMEGRSLYGENHKLSANQFYNCGACGSRVGIHNTNKNSLGTLANVEL